MSIITCPQCNKRISDKAKQCPHCSTDMDMDVEDREQLARSRMNKKIQQISTQNMFAVLLAMGGFYVLYFQSPEPNSPQSLISTGVIAVGFSWYIVNRIRHFLIKNKVKKP